MGWIKARPAQKLLVRVKLTGNLHSYRTCISVNGRHWNTCKLVFLGTCTLVLGLALVSMGPVKFSHCDTNLCKQCPLVSESVQSDTTDDLHWKKWQASCQLTL